MDSPKVIRLMQQLAVSERDVETARLRGDNAIAAFTREQRRLRLAVESLRAIMANDWNADRQREIALRTLQEIGS